MRELGYHTPIPKKRTASMYHTTGFTRDEILDMCVDIYHAKREHAEWSWAPILGSCTSVVVALTYLRRNRVQAELAGYTGVSQPTISRAVCAVTTILGELLRSGVRVAEDIGHGRKLMVDGTLLPCWSWARHPELYSGEHHTTGLNVQVVCDLHGRLVWISDPMPGARHDVAVLRESGVLDALNPSDWLGDKGYIGTGTGIDTPTRKPADRTFYEWEKNYNTSGNRIRWVIEQTIANITTWRILHTDYRRPYATFHETISTVIALIFHKAT